MRLFSTSAGYIDRFLHFCVYFPDLNIQLQEVLAALLGISFLFQIYFLLVYHNKLNAYRITEELNEAQFPVSVIISARNEAENLSKYLPNILEQQYPVFEVVVINDCSVDDSEYILEQFEHKYSHLKVVRVTEHAKFKTGKKFAVTMGIKAAKYDHLLFTDADCQPVSENWIARMAAQFQNPEHQIILGYSPYYKTGSLVNILIRFETVKTAINYFSAALRGNAYMGVGRNMAYTKDVFFKAKGFASHMHIMSGDDDLFVNQNATPQNTAIEIHPDSFMYSEPKAGFGAWFRQKRRHMGAGKMYKARHKRLLSADALTGLLFYGLLIACLFFKPAVYAAAGLFGLRWLLQILVYRKQFIRFQAKDLLWFLPLLDIVYYVYLNVFGLIGSVIKTSKWK